MKNYYYSNLHKAANVAKHYDDRFLSEPLAEQGIFEKRILSELIRRFNPTSIMDLACGTGRILSYIDEVDFNLEIELQGLDNSQPMLKIAKQRVPRATFVSIDFEKPENFEARNAYEYITCFRFFANSDLGLREDAINFIDHIISPGGIVIVNNHKNSLSPSMILFRLKSKNRNSGVRNDDIAKMFKAKGFKLIEMRSTGVWIQNENRYYLLKKCGRYFDQFLNSRKLNKHPFGINTVMTFQKLIG